MENKILKPLFEELKGLASVYLSAGSNDIINLEVDFTNSILNDFVGKDLRFIHGSDLNTCKYGDTDDHIVLDVNDPDFCKNKNDFFKGDNNRKYHFLDDNCAKMERDMSDFSYKTFCKILDLILEENK